MRPEINVDPRTVDGFPDAVPAQSVSNAAQSVGYVYRDGDWTAENEGDVTETEDDLRTTAEAIIVDAEKIKDIERTKLELDPADPQIIDLARQAETVAARLLQEAVIERELAATAAREKTTSEQD